MTGTQRVALVLLSALGCVGLACGSGDDASSGAAANGGATVDDSLKNDLRTIRGVRFYFGHHSVGFNLLEGIAALSKEAGIPVEIVAENEHRPGLDGRIEHGEIARNKEPFQKVDAFVHHLEGAGSDGPQIAFMKFCYVDFDPGTDVDKLFDYYQQAVARLKTNKPGVRLVHFTTPLMAQPLDWKSRVQRLLGRLVWEDAANVKRAQYNEKLRAAFRGEPLFDLATVESTRPDGTRESFRYEGQQAYALWQGYTEDGGHLNGLGERVAARALIHTMADAARAAGFGGELTTRS